MTWCVSAQVLSQSPWLPCLSSVSHSQPLDYVSSCSKTRRIWVGKYTHMWQYIPSFSSVSLPPSFCFPPSDVYPLFFSIISAFLILLPNHLPSFFSVFSFSALPLPPEVSHYFPKKKVLLTATFSKNNAVVSKPPCSGKHMFLCTVLVKRKLVKSLIFSHVGDEMKCAYIPTSVHMSQKCVCMRHEHLTWQSYLPFAYSLFMCDMFPKWSQCLMLSHQMYCSCLFLH